jgi:type IV pilus assembly protein PilM
MEDGTGMAPSCPKCDAPNSNERQFCAKCGRPLRELCFHCGEICVAGENFCSVCGANLGEAAAERIGRADAAFRAAAEKQAACRFDEAIELLTSIAQDKHPRLAERTARARQLIQHLRAQRERQQSAEEEAYYQAKQFFAASDYEGAAEALRDVPPALQGDKTEQLRRQIQERRQEVASLTEELREAVRAKRLGDVLRRINQLLALKPHHAYAMSLVAPVQGRLLSAAEKRLADSRYDEALQLLDQLPREAGGPQLAELRREASELAWLAWDLRHAPMIDTTLLAVAERLRRLRPQDEKLAKVCDELERRRRRAAKHARLEPMAWASPPPETALGVAIDWLTGFRRLRLGPDIDLSDLRQQPGRFGVACGLALAGVRQAAMPIDLLTLEQRGAMGQVARMMRAGKPRIAWGIDLGTSALKAVKISWDEKKQEAVVGAALLIEHAKALNLAVNEAEEAKLVGDTLKAFVAGQTLKAERLCVGLPGRMAISRKIEVPPVESRRKGLKLVEFEARLELDLPLEQLIWDFQPLGRKPAGAAPLSDIQPSHALLIASKRQIAARFLEPLRRAGLRPDLLQPDFVALHNLLAYEQMASPPADVLPDEMPALASIDIGCNSTNVLVSSPRSLWFHSCGIGGHSFTRALVKQFNLTVAQAEQQKRAPESAERLCDLYEALSPLFGDLLNDVQHSLAAYAETEPDCRVHRALGCGGGFALHGLFRYLRCGR